MKLNEWKDSKGNKVSTSSSGSGSSPVSISSTKGGYWERFNRLLFYHVNHKSPAVDKVVRTKVSKDGFHYTEHYRAGLSGYDKDVVVKIDPATESWTLQTYIDGKPHLGGAGDGYTNLLKELRKHLTIPVTGTPEYKNLLTEWVDSNGKKVSLSTSSTPSASGSSSKTNKEKFTSLLYYMMKNKGSLVDKAEVVRLDDGGFTYKEHYKSSSKDYVLTLLVGYSRFNSSWRYELYMDTNLVREIQGSGWEDLLEELEKYFHVPKAGSKEYKSLCEWVDSKGKKVGTSFSASSQPTSATSSNTFYKDKFKKLLDYHMAHSTALNMNIDKLSEDDSKASFSYVEEYENVKGKISESLIGVRYYKKYKTWTVKVYIDGIRTTTKKGVGFNILIAELDARLTLPPRNSTEYQDLLEWVDAKGKKVSHTTSTSSQPTNTSQEDRYKKLIAQIDTDGIATYKVNKLTDTILDFKVSTKYRPAGYSVRIEYIPATDDFTLQVADGTVLKGNDWNEDILTLFGAGAILRETDLLRESYSLADDFRLYETLWD